MQPSSLHWFFLFVLLTCPFWNSGGTGQNRLWGNKAEFPTLSHLILRLSFAEVEWKFVVLNFLGREGLGEGGANEDSQY